MQLYWSFNIALVVVADFPSEEAVSVFCKQPHCVVGRRKSFFSTDSLLTINTAYTSKNFSAYCRLNPAVDEPSMHLKCV